jgi:hypothetical protein
VHVSSAGTCNRHTGTGKQALIGVVFTSIFFYGASYSNHDKGRRYKLQQERTAMNFNKTVQE